LLKLKMRKLKLIKKNPIKIAKGVLNWKKNPKFEIVKNEFNLCCKGDDPRIYENSIFPAYEKNKIITPCMTLL